MAPALVPELSVRDLAPSLAFYTGVLGFHVVYDRPDTGFALIEREGARLMLEAVSGGSWITAALEPPFGRGINFEIAVSDLGVIEAAIRYAALPLFRPAEEAWYRAGARWLGQRQLLVQDPDGYLLRLAQSLGVRDAPPADVRAVG